ncbi:Wzz/FepE/Etk N-terminal domain-containing protein [Bradyrhizobium diazoefficiens]|uniref:Wzz/FepE/Etk N-terminal domain-containing protein n=1 Tax=Bradyrhizobium diazoefficiens TaxID=1355477 RepID=UPI00272994B1|nr:Wzz/FepE/Etk N-terminal domain-containing protein [Bradyrhizobium diazoefficiens]WLA67669.1 Wzz/FepE/Etk N-terminal domain-containing protein [Bradyrhizobium diazoefficiens]
MLQTSRIYNLSDPDTPPPEFRLPTELLANGFAFIRRRLLIILLTSLATLSTALFYLIAAVPTFTADAQIVVDSKAAPGDAASVSTIVESQIAIIRSENIALAVIGKLGLAEDPEFARRDGALRRTLRSISRQLGWTKPETQLSAMRYAVESFERKLSVKRVGLTYIVEVTFDSTDPERAAQILNTLADTYIAAQMDAKYISALRNEKWVKDRLNELSSQASAAKRAVANYQARRKDIAESAAAVDAGTQSTELRELESSADAATRTYENFLRQLRYMEAQQQSLGMLEAHMLNGASVPLRASSPKLVLVLGLAAIAGVVIGIVIGMLRDLLDRGIRTSQQVCNELQVACIAVVPASKSAGPKLGALFGDAAARHERALPANPRTRIIAHTESPIWTITDAPHSRFTESFLEIKLAIDSVNRTGRRNLVIGITSTQADEGKSTVAAALALLVANAGAKVVLVDCNLRNRSLSGALAPAAELGVLDVMSGTASVREAMWIEPTTQLAFLPVGNSSRPIYASEILGSESLDRMFQALRDAYEYVIVDLPAVAPFSDVRAAACALDSFIVVIEASRTNIDVAKRGLDVIRHENIVGVVLNKAKYNGL